MTILHIFLAVIGGLLVYAWAIYAVLLRLAGNPEPPIEEAEDLPSVAVLLSAYNEEKHIADRIRNLQSLNYPTGRLRVFLGLDGCKDATAARAAAAAGTGSSREIVVQNFPVNRGKMSVLKDLFAIATREAAPDVVVFTDANTVFEKDALRILCRRFADPAVGGVCGRLVFLSKKGAEVEENLYWKLENWFKAHESDVDSCLGANGAIYAIRRELFWKEIPSNTVIDDFVIGMKVREQRRRMVYEPAAVAYEHLAGSVEVEWKRRMRIGAGNFQSLRLCAACLSPRFGRFAWIFWSHKVLRWFTPHLMLAGFLLAVAGYLRYGDRTAAGLALAGSVAILAALVGNRVSVRTEPFRLLRSISYFFTMQAAIAAGFFRYLAGNVDGRWERTARE